MLERLGSTGAAWLSPTTMYPSLAFDPLALQLALVHFVVVVPQSLCSCCVSNCGLVFIQICVYGSPAGICRSEFGFETNGCGKVPDSTLILLQVIVGYTSFIVCDRALGIYPDGYKEVFDRSTGLAQLNESVTAIVVRRGIARVETDGLVEGLDRHFETASVQFVLTP